MTYLTAELAVAMWIYATPGAHGIWSLTIITHAGTELVFKLSDFRRAEKTQILYTVSISCSGFLKGHAYEFPSLLPVCIEVTADSL